MISGVSFVLSVVTKFRKTYMTKIYFFLLFGNAKQTLKFVILNEVKKIISLSFVLIRCTSYAQY